MKKFFFFGLLFSLLALYWCNWLNTKKYDIMFYDDFFDWFTWQIIIVDDSNKYDEFVQTWKQLLYINDIYWFKIILWKEWIWTKIVEFARDTPYPQFRIDFLKTWWIDNPSEYSVIFSIFAINNEFYNSISDEWSPATKNDLDEIMQWANNKYSFLEYWWNKDRLELLSFFPFLDCDSKIHDLNIYLSKDSWDCYFCQEEKNDFEVQDFLSCLINKLLPYWIEIFNID